MMYNSYEDKYWEFESLAHNNPLFFIKSLAEARRKVKLPDLAWGILEASAANTCGKLNQVELFCARHETGMKTQSDSFLAAKFYLLKKR